MTAGNGDLSALLTNMFALTNLCEDSNPYEPTPIRYSQDTNSNSFFDIAFPSFGAAEAAEDAGGLEDTPIFGEVEDDCGYGGIWFTQEESHVRTQNMTFAFAA
jgi:hypothetical protein